MSDIGIDEERLNEGVRLTYAYVYEDFFIAAKGSKSDALVVGGWVVVMAAMGALWYWFAGTRESPRVGGTSDWVFIARWSLPVVFIVGLLYNRRSRERRHRLHWEQEHQAQQFQVLFSAAGVTWETAQARVEEKWSLYAHHGENELGFWLFPADSPEKPILIPARAVPREQLPLFRELLRRHARQSQGFPVVTGPRRV